MSDTNATQSTQQTGGKIGMPGTTTLNNAAKLSIKLGRPLDFYFYIDSCRGNAQIVNADGEKIIYKNNEEHTSPIKNTYKSRISSLYNVTKVRPISTIPCKKANLIISHVLYPSRVKSTPTSPGMDVLEFFRICSFLCEFITDLISWYSSLDM